MNNCSVLCNIFQFIAFSSKDETKLLHQGPIHLARLYIDTSGNKKPYVNILGPLRPYLVLPLSKQ